MPERSSSIFREVHIRFTRVASVPRCGNSGLANGAWRAQGDFGAAGGGNRCAVHRPVADGEYLSEADTQLPGYTFGPHFSRRTGREHMGYSPSKKSVKRIRQKVAEHLAPNNVAPREEVGDRLNQETERLESVFRTGESV